MPRLSRGSRSADSSLVSSQSYPRYTTYTPEELEKTFARYSHIGAGEGVGIALSAVQSGGGRTRLIKGHECCVSYPDGTSGLCKYTRGGPAWHVFRFEQTSHQQHRLTESAAMFTATAPTYLPAQNCTERMGNTLALIEAKAKELAVAAFAEAVARERDERFRRASVPTGYNRYHIGNRSSDPSRLDRPQMSTKRAKEMAGKYALCLCIGSGENQRFIPCTGVNNQNVYDNLAEANEAWHQCPHRARRLVACLCRYNRQWELPVYNPLHADGEYAVLLGLNALNVETGPDETELY